jgi:hypothetical protein
MTHVLRRAASVVAALVLGAASAATASSAAAAETGLSGVVTSEDGMPIAACVNAYTPSYEYVAGTCTEDGQWAIPELADGSYRVRVDGAHSHISEWAQDAATIEEATDVVAPGTVDVALAVGGFLTGTLTDSDGAPVPGASIWAYEADSFGAGTQTPVESATSDDAGDWTMVVRPGAYKVSMSNWPAEVWAFGASSAETASTLDVTAGATTRVDDSFKPAAKVTGRITEAKTKRPVAGACAALISPAGNPDGEHFGRACADETGTYDLTAWAAGTYVMLFTDPSGRFAAEYSGGATTLSQAKPVRVVAGSTATASAALDIGAVLKGRVVNAVSGEGIPDVCPGAYSGRTGPYVPGQASTCSNEVGAYELGGLPAAATTLVLSPRWDSGMADSWYLAATEGWTGHDASGRAPRARWHCDGRRHRRPRQPRRRCPRRPHGQLRRP